MHWWCRRSCAHVSGKLIFCEIKLYTIGWGTKNAELNSPRTAGADFLKLMSEGLSWMECFTSLHLAVECRFPGDSPSKEDQTTFHLKEFLGSWAIGSRWTATSFLAHSKMMSFAGFKRFTTILQEIGNFVVPGNSSWRRKFVVLFPWGYNEDAIVE